MNVMAKEIAVGGGDLEQWALDEWRLEAEKCCFIMSQVVKFDFLIMCIYSLKTSIKSKELKEGVRQCKKKPAFIIIFFINI